MKQAAPPNMMTNAMKTTTPTPARKTLSLHVSARNLSTSFFFFVWAPGRRSPRQRHPTREAAIAEAERLSAANPGVLYVAYEARAIARKVAAS